MKTIKIFLASSEEMDYDRMAFGNLVRKLDDIYEKRGIRIKLFEWEDFDAAFNDRRKQDEYNDNVRKSDIFLALFHRKAGQFTIEEFDVASESFRDHASPKVYAYLKDLKQGEEESPELAEFKHRLFDEMGHYWCRYDNKESLQFQFVMQLQLVEASLNDSVDLEDGRVVIDGTPVADMNRLKFAAGNEDYTRMGEELASLPAKIEKARTRVEKFPDDEDLADDLQQKLNRYNKLKDEMAEYQKILFDTAKRVASLQGERVSDRMRRAMDAFNEGKVKEANIILDEAEADAKRNLEDYRQSKEITERKRQTVILSLEELLLKASTVMADSSIPLEERVERTETIYDQVEAMAREIDYDQKKYADLLFKSGIFLRRYAKYDKALEKFTKAVDIIKGLGKNPTRLYQAIGTVYKCKGDYEKSFELYCKALTIKEKLFGKEHPALASSYNNLGQIYFIMGEYSMALDNYKKALSIIEKIKGKEHSATASLYSSIGNIYSAEGKIDKAIELLNIGMAIDEKVYGKDNPVIASSYNNIGIVYKSNGNYDKALELFEKSLAIYEKVFGKRHPDTASVYSNIGSIYLDKGDYCNALEYLNKSLDVRERVFGSEHLDTAESLKGIGDVYYSQMDYEKALEFYMKTLAIQDKLLDMDNPAFLLILKDEAGICINVGDIYKSNGDYDKALDFYRKAQKSLRNRIGYLNLPSPFSKIPEMNDNRMMASVKYKMGSIYCFKQDYKRALERFQDSYTLFKDVFGDNYPETLEVKKNIDKLSQMETKN